MSKMRHVPIDDALRQFRFNALNAPLVAKDMTTLDKEMSDILSRTDLSKENKLKKYYETLAKFQEARDLYKGVAPTTLDSSNQVPQIMETAMKKNEEKQLPNTDMEASEGISSLFGDLYNTANSILDDGNAQFSTPNTTNTSTPVSSKSAISVTPVNKKKSMEKTKPVTEWEKYKMKEHFLNSIDLKNNKIRIRSPGKANEFKTIGNIDQVDSIFDYLFSKTDDAITPTFKAGKKNNQLMQNVLTFLKQNPSSRTWDKKYPILKQKFGKIAGSGQKKQKGFGKAKINYKQWDYLNKKLKL